jgi:RHS repeat-associated protein
MHDYFNCTAVVSTSGVVQERYGYNGFGQVRFVGRSFGNLANTSFGWETLFANYRWDEETWLYQVRYRYFHPNLGRWLSRDPLGEPGFASRDLTSHNPIGELGPIKSGRVDWRDTDGIMSVFHRINPRFGSRIKARLSQSLAIITTQNTSLHVFADNQPLLGLDPCGLLTFKLYGNYCGPGWCDGQHISEKYCATLTSLVQPIDAMDACCKTHDLCIGPAITHAQMQACDRALCDCVSALNPADIDPPPGKDLNYVKNIWQGIVGVFCCGTVPGH